MTRYKEQQSEKKKKSLEVPNKLLHRCLDRFSEEGSKKWLQFLPPLAIKLIF